MVEQASWLNHSFSDSNFTLGVTAFLLASIVDPADDANYIVTTAAVLVAALNVLFTLWLLRTAQKQLHILAQQVVDQQEGSLRQLKQLRASHDAERNEAREQLGSLREQLDFARESNAAERAEATVSLSVSRDAVDEALKTRLDQLAPRVSLAVDAATLLLKQRGQNRKVTSTKAIPDPESLVGLANCWLEYIFQLTLKNWGKEPVAVSLASPWENQQSGLLFPDETWKLAHTFMVSTSNLREIAESGIKMNSDKPEWIFPVLADDLVRQR